MENKHIIGTNSTKSFKLIGWHIKIHFFPKLADVGLPGILTLKNIDIEIGF